MTLSARTDVLIVGAGPVGMTAAILLASDGASVRVVERNAQTSDDPKAISLDDESLRVYQRAGIADDVLTVIVPGTGTMYFGADDAPLFHGRAAVPFRFGFPFKNPFAQPDLERVLRAALHRHPLVDLRFSTELISFSDSTDGVTATVRDAHGMAEVEATFILGADGGRSAVRTHLDIAMTGRSHDDVWLVIDCIDDERTERYGMHHADPSRPHVIVPGLHGRCRYEFYLHPGEGGPTRNPPFALIERLLAPYRSIRPHQVERAVAYRFHGLCADEWQRGNAFLLGDAAHMMPPFAGQGLNSGIRDAANLTWKLAAVLRGDASTALLDTYENERKPHAQAVIRSSERLGRVVMTTNTRLAEFRDRAVRRAMQDAEGRRYFEGMQFRPSTRITGGLVMGVDADPLVGTTIGQPDVFDFAAHRVVPLDDLAGTGWTVFGVEIGSDPGHTAWRSAVDEFAALTPSFVDVPLDDRVYDRPAEVSIAIDVDTRLYAEFAAARGYFVVTRPDRVIAAIIDSARVRDGAMQLRELIAGRAPVPATPAAATRP